MYFTVSVGFLSGTVLNIYYYIINHVRMMEDNSYNSIWDHGSEMVPISSDIFIFKETPTVHVRPLQLLSYALESSLSIMELQWPELLIMRTF